MIMRDTIQLVTDRLSGDERDAVAHSIQRQVERVAQYVPGYRLKQAVQFADEGGELDLLVPPHRRSEAYSRVSVYLEVEGAAMYLPAYAGNLDIMTSAAARTAEHLVAARGRRLA